jgi:hypothetical protein
VPVAPAVEDALIVHHYFSELLAPQLEHARALSRGHGLDRVLMAATDLFRRGTCQVGEAQLVGRFERARGAIR